MFINRLTLPSEKKRTEIKHAKSSYTFVACEIFNKNTFIHFHKYNIGNIVYV
jgi:hypothetical protein